MPTLVNIIERVTKWAEDNICKPVKLKVPPDDLEEADGAGYEYTLATPAAFPLFVPSKEKLPPKVRAPIPSVCIRIIDGEDGATMGNVNMEMWFSVWNPGTHGQDILKPVDGLPLTLKAWKGSEAQAHFERNADGWRDVWNWIDTALRALESTASIDGLAINRDVPFRYGPAKDEEGIQDFYPFWFGYISFAIERPIVRNIEEYDQYL